MPAAAAEPPLPAAAAETPATRCKPAARTALGVLAIALLIAASYLPTTRAGFLWDDVIFTEHQAVREWSDIWSIWFSPGHVQNEGHYWPVVYTSFWIEHKLWGLEPLGYHLVNVLLHFANSLLLWLALRRLVVPGAWLVAAVFAVHPLHVESVAWIIERKDLLSTLLYIAAVLAWLRFQAKGRRRSYLLALGAFLAGLLSKSVVVTLPAALLILRWRQRGRLDLRDLLYMAPFAAVGLVTTLADYLFYSSRESVDIGLSAIERLLLAARALVFYASKLLWPHGLLGIYPRWDVSATDPLAWAYLALAVVVPALLWRVRHGIGRGPLAGVLFFAVTLAPALGFIDYGYMQFSFVADRFQYLAGTGLIAVVVGAGAAGAARLPRRGRMAALAVPAAVLVVLGVLTWRHAEIYRNDETFFRHIVSLNPTARGAYDNLNKHLNDQGRLEEFLTSARTALEHLPQDPTSNINYGLALVKSGQVDEGIAYYRRALELEPGNSRALDDLARLLGQTGRYDQALEVWRAAAAARPRQIRPHLSMGVIEQQRGNHQAAQRHYARALAIDPGDADTRHKLGVLDFDLGRYEAALDHFRAALELQAQDDLRARLHSGIGAALFRLDRPDQAVRSLQRALALDPSLREARDNLERIRGGDGAAALLREGRFQAALAAARGAIERDPRDATAHFHAGAAMWELGRPDQAERYYRLAVDLDPGHKSALFNLAGLLRHKGQQDEALRLYRAAAEAHPDYAEPHRGLGLIEQARGNAQAAARHYAEALRLGLRDSVVLHNLGKLRIGTGDYAEAAEHLREALELTPNDARIHANLGVAQFQLGRPEAAIRSFERALEIDPSLQSARDNLQRLRRRAG